MAANANDGATRRTTSPTRTAARCRTEPLSAPLAVTGYTGTHEAPPHTKDDDFFQAGSSTA